MDNKVSSEGERVGHAHGYSASDHFNSISTDYVFKVSHFDPVQFVYSWNSDCRRIVNWKLGYSCLHVNKMSKRGKMNRPNPKAVDVVGLRAANTLQSLLCLFPQQVVESPEPSSACPWASPWEQSSTAPTTRALRTSTSWRLEGSKDG